MGVVMALSGLVGIAIPLMDHHYILLGYLLCWASALAICVVYYPHWKLAIKNHFGEDKYKRKLDSKDYLFAPIFAVIYIAAPLVISFSDSNFDDYLLYYGTNPPGFSYRQNDPNSFAGARVGTIKADGRLISENIGNGYKLFGILFHHSHAIDPKDEADISKSGPYDVTSQEIDIQIPWNQRFFDELIAGMHGTSYALVAIPSRNSSEKFDSVRDVINLGGRVLTMRGGPP
jgi:hypothetical protein